MSFTSKLEGVIPMTIYSVLSGEHDEVRTLITLLEASPDALAGTREPALAKLRRELLSHSEAEDLAVYSRVNEHLPTSELIKHARKEHEEIEQHLNALLTTDVRSKEWKEHLRMLKHALEHHVHEEESVIFDRMRIYYTDAQARDMAKDFQRLKEHRLKLLKDETKERYVNV